MGGCFNIYYYNNDRERKRGRVEEKGEGLQVVRVCVCMCVSVQAIIIYVVVEIQNAKRIKRWMAGPPAANIVHNINMLNGPLKYFATGYG